MIEMRNVLKTKLNKKGFTLAELLVVVAIIAILVAVSIPIFAGKLNQAKKSTDAANVRAAKAAVVSEYLQNENLDTTSTVKYEYDAENGTVKIYNGGSPSVKGYGQSSTNKGKVILVTVAPGTGTGEDRKPEITTTWFQ